MPRHRTLSIRTRGSATKIAPKGTPTMTKVTLALAQINPLVGDIPGNTQKVLAQARYAQEQLGASAIVFPELVLSGYPPEEIGRASCRERGESSEGAGAVKEQKQRGRGRGTI